MAPKNTKILKTEKLCGELLKRIEESRDTEGRKVVSEKIVDKMFDDFKKPSFWRLWFDLKPHWWWNDFTYWLRKKKQKWTTGFPHCESYDFFSWHAKIVVPRLKMLKDNLNGCPASFGDEYSDVDKGCEAWKEIIEKMIWSFENIDKEPMPIKPENYDSRQKVTEYSDGSVSYDPLDKRKWDWTPCEEHQKKVQEGLDLFAKHYQNLWD